MAYTQWHIRGEHLRIFQAGIDRTMPLNIHGQKVDIVDIDLMRVQPFRFEEKTGAAPYRKLDHLVSIEGQ